MSRLGWFDLVSKYSFWRVLPNVVNCLQVAKNMNTAFFVRKIELYVSQNPHNLITCFVCVCVLFRFANNNLQLPSSIWIMNCTLLALKPFLFLKLDLLVYLPIDFETASFDIVNAILTSAVKINSIFVFMF